MRKRESLIAAHRPALSELRQMCSGPSDAYSAAAWCEAANDAVGIALELFDALDGLISFNKGLVQSAASEERGCVDMRVRIDAHSRAVWAVERADAQ